MSVARVALVVDWLDKYGGAERVLSSMNTIFKFERCYTLINLMKNEDLEKIFPETDKVKIEQTIIKKTGKRFRYYFLSFPLFFNTLKINSDIDVIISSSHAFAKGIKKSRKKDQLHISYFQARNVKYIWDDYKLYFKAFRFLMYPFIKILRIIDVRSSKQPDYIISNSKFVQNWVSSVYNRESIVIYPPVDLSQFAFNENKKDYYVAVGRLEPYKRFDIIINAFNKMPNKKLKIVGDGSQFKKLKQLANKNIEFIGFVSSQEVYENIKFAKGFIHAGIEDFGIAPIEAQACGTPVIAYGFGGVLETVIDRETGVFFYNHNPIDLVKTINDFEKIKFDFKKVRENALKFSKESFEEEIKSFVEKKMNNYKRT